MPRSRPASSPLSYHKHTGQYYITRSRRRIYLGADQDEALNKYYRLAIGQSTVESQDPGGMEFLSVKEMANRFLEAQQANWRNPQATLRCYQDWLGRFLKDHPGMIAADLNVEMFANWKISLRQRNFSVESINHYLNAVRALYRFGEDAGLIAKAPPLRRVKNEKRPIPGSVEKPLYSVKDVDKLLKTADYQMRAMILLGLNCGFGPKDIEDLAWSDINGDRVTLPRSKTGVCQTFLLWPETQQVLNNLRENRAQLFERLAKRSRFRTDKGRVFITRFWKPWCKDAVSHAFKKLCKAAGVPCHGFYRLRHCASTAVSLEASPHVQRRFMRHSQLQQQVTYTHVPDAEVDDALMKARTRLLGDASEDSENDPEQAGAA
jgi:integrase